MEVIRYFKVTIFAMAGFLVACEPNASNSNSSTLPTENNASLQPPPLSPEEHRRLEIIAVSDGIKRTTRIYLGEEESWPMHLAISDGSSQKTICGPTPAGYCPADNTIAFSAEFMLDATHKSAWAIPFIVGHEIAHGIIINTGTPPRHSVLHELAADCIAAMIMVEKFDAISKMSEQEHAELAAFTHSIGDPFFLNRDHHGFGAQRYIAYQIGYEAQSLAAKGDASHANDCTLIFAE